MIDHNALTAQTEDRAQYIVTRDEATEADDAIIARALQILEQRMRAPGAAFTSPDVVKSWMRLNVGSLPHEVFGCIWLDCQNRVIEAGEMFRGSLTQASVYPREVVKEALRLNAAAVIMYHNHPSGSDQPSGADELLTRNLRDTLRLIDTKVLDHFIVTTTTCTSMAEKGLI